MSLINKKEAAKEFGISEITLDRLRKKGLPSYKLGRKVMFDKEVVEKWVKGDEGVYAELCETYSQKVEETLENKTYVFDIAGFQNIGIEAQSEQSAKMKLLDKMFEEKFITLV